MIWLDQEGLGHDQYVAIRGAFTLAAAGRITLRVVGSSWYQLWLDGQPLLEGPLRYEAAHPEYQERAMELAPGRHVIAACVNRVGIVTRVQQNLPGFLDCRIFAGSDEVPVVWRAWRLDGYRPAVRRLNGQLGWAEWCDTRKNPPGWRCPDFDDGMWPEAVEVGREVGAPQAASINDVRQFSHTLEPVAEGPLAEVFGYELDDIPFRFFARDLECQKFPAEGVWRRYDLGRVRLGRCRFVLDLPPGTQVEMGYAEYLMNGRVAPYVSPAGGPTANLDHYIARGGVQTFGPITPRGGRFVELHVSALPHQVRFIEERFIERTYYGAPAGAFSTNDPFLNRAWSIGVETLRACAEDAIVDNPTRERGQWMSDLINVGMQIAAVAYPDLRLFRRALIQAAQGARDDGLVAGMSIGNKFYLASGAIHWITGTLDYYRLTGDVDLLRQLHPAAVANFHALERHWGQAGLEEAGWDFMDWGYVPDSQIDAARNLFYLEGLRALIEWEHTLGNTHAAPACVAREAQLAELLINWFRGCLEEGGNNWERIGYHSAVLGMRMGLIPAAQASQCIEFIKHHWLRCFPNNPQAPRNSRPFVYERRLVTPYFAHWAFPLLAEHGEMDFVLNQYRSYWGWALEEGLTTWPEVFDLRWSHCHQWGGCPTWQLSRYVLGLHARFDLGPNHYALKLRPGPLTRASGAIPFPGKEEVLRVEWERTGDEVFYRLQTPKPVKLHLSGENEQDSTVQLEAGREWSHLFKIRDIG